MRQENILGGRMAWIYSNEFIESQKKRVSPNTAKGLLIDIYDLELYRTGDKNCRICGLISDFFKSKNIEHLLPNNKDRFQNKEKNEKEV